MGRIPTEPLILNHEIAIAAGGNRSVYWPSGLDWLAKVILPEVRRSRTTWLDDLGRRLRPSGAQWAQQREYAAWVALARRSAGAQDLPVARLGGFVGSDLGPALLAEPVLAAPPGGGLRLLAPTLASLLEGGSLTPVHLGSLTVMAHQLLKLNTVARDLTPMNICWGYAAFSPVSTGPRFVLIDGLGDKNTIPLRSMVRRVNQAKLHRSFRNLGNGVGFSWTGSAFQPR